MKPTIQSADEFRASQGLPKAGRLKPGELDGASEKQVVMEIITALESKGFCRPSHWRPGAHGIYMRAGQHRADKGGSDKGLPDLIVAKFSQHAGATFRETYLFEVKARTKSARPSVEQAQLATLGVIQIVNSAAQVLAALGRG